MSDDYEVIKKELNELKNILDNHKKTYLKKAAYKHDQQKSIKSVLDCIKKEIDNTNQIILDIFSKTAFSSKDEWQKADTNQKQEIIKQIRKNLPTSLKNIDKRLRRIENAKKEAWAVIIVGIICLVFLATLYLVIHNTKQKMFYDTQAEDVIFQHIGQIKAELSQSKVKIYNVNYLLQNFSDDNTYNDKLMLFTAFRKEIAYLRGITCSLSDGCLNWQAHTETKDKNKKVFSTDNTGSTLIDQNDQRLVELKSEIDKMAKEADAFSRNAGYFWIVGTWRWLEVIFWGEFGVLVGILAWVSRKVEEGEFTKERFDNEVLWYLTEIFIGPVVIVAAFFLLNQFIGTMLSGVSTDNVRMSIYITLGLSFTLGLFLRRTLGIFDSIKNRLPLPGSIPGKQN